MIGAAFGFALGMFVDVSLLQTLGVNSLALVAVGYGAGRIRELRDPAHSLAPIAVGAAATFVAADHLHAAAVPARRAGAGLAAARA